MSERLAPETDALILSKAGFGATDHEWRQQSRRLEQERDEAREKLCKVLQILDDYDQAIKNPSSPFWGSFKKWFTWEAAK